MSHSSSRTSLAAIVAVLLVASCGGAGAGPEPGLPECTGNVTVQVSAGTQPTIGWTPACRAFLVVVELSPTGHDSWIVRTPGRNGIAPGIVYGTVPAGAVADAPATPLASGQAYDVAVRRFTSPGPDDGVLLGATTFTP